MFYISLVSYLTIFKTLPCTKSVYTHILHYFLYYFYVRLLTLNDPWHFIVLTIILMTYPW